MLQQSIPLPKSVVRPPETVLVNITPQETRVAILEEGSVCELHIERSAGWRLVGNIYLGVVRRVLPGMQSAFIDIGLERAAFLHVVDLLEQKSHQADPRRIEHIVFEGQSILVQVIKDPVGTKGARLTTQISLAGRFLVHLPQDNHIGVSQRIENDEERLQLKERLASLIPENSAQGFIIRTSAEEATDEELAADIDYLTKFWAHIKKISKTCPAETLIYQDLPLSLRVLRDMFSDNTQGILVDSHEQYHKMREFSMLYAHGATDKIKVFSGERSLFETYGVEEEIDAALKPRVDLKFGGYLIIEPTEAMTTIDVNTGGFVGGHNFTETIFKTNLEACYAIAREIRLRNLGGIIIVDFIDMIDENHREKVMRELSKSLSFDRTRVTLNGFTSLGLVEITRKRTRENLRQTLCEICPSCYGSGQIKTTQTVCYEILRELIRVSKWYDAAELRVLASPSVIEMLIDEESQSLAMLSDFIGKPVSLSVESTYNQDQFDIVV